jgi:hypothetical protein
VASVPLVELALELKDPRPISINAMYSSSQQRRFLTAAGRHFKDALTAAVARQVLLSPVPWPLVEAAVYQDGAHAELHIDLYLAVLHNRSWKVGGALTRPKNQEAQRQRRSPYQKLDGSNYIKLIEDAVARGTGIDDSVNLFAAIRKHEDQKNPRVRLRYRIVEYAENDGADQPHEGPQ